MNSAMPDIVVLHSGTHFHLASLADRTLLVYRLTAIHVKDVPAAAQRLHQADAIIVADRQRTDLLENAAPDILEAHHAGVDLVVLGENHVAAWLPGIREAPRQTNFWWWRTGEDSRIRPVAPEHPAWEIFSERAAVWHYHGVLHGGPDARSLVDLHTETGARDGSILLLDDSGPARLLVATMDPFYHHGSGFMPGATQLFHAIFHWVSRVSGRQRCHAAPAGPAPVATSISAAETTPGRRASR